MTSEGRRDRILERFGKLIDAPENRETAQAIREARHAYEAREMEGTEAERLLAAYEEGVSTERKEQDKKRAVAKPYTKFFRDDSTAFAALSFKAKALHATLQKPPVDPDGTVALLRSSEIESPDKAIFRSLGVSGPERRSFRNAARELFEAGLLVVEGDRVKLPHWEARQGWNGGPVPRPICEPDARFNSPDKVDERPKNDPRTTEGRPKDDVNTTKGRQSESSSASESLDPIQNGRGRPPSLLFSASRGARGNPEARGGPPATTPPEGSGSVPDPSEKKGRAAPSARPSGLDWSTMDADQTELLAAQLGTTDPDADDGYSDDHFLHEVDPTDAHRLDEGGRKKWEATRRFQ